MKILALSRQICVLCGFCSPAEESDLRLKFRQLLNIMFILSNLVIMELSFAMHALLALEMNNMVDFFFDFLQMTANMSLLLSYISIVFQRQNTKKLFNKLQTISDQYEHFPSASHYYFKTNELCRKITKWPLTIQSITYVAPGLVLLVAGTIFYYDRDGYVETKKLYMPLKTRTPLDENTFLGFCVIFYINYVAALAYVTMTVLISSLILTTGLFFNTFRAHFELMFENMNDLVSDHRPSDYVIRLKSCVVEAIDFHNQAKDVFEVAKQVMSGSVFCQLVFGVLFISTTNFELEVVMKSLNPSIFVLLPCVSLSTGFVFLFCSVGSYTTDNFFRYGEVSYESLWYKFPTDLQQYLRLIIADAQRPRVFQGFGIINLNLMAFAKVMKTVASYYLMFKNVVE